MRSLKTIWHFTSFGRCFLGRRKSNSNSHLALQALNVRHCCMSTSPLMYLFINRLKHLPSGQLKYGNIGAYKMRAFQAGVLLVFERHRELKGAEVISFLKIDLSSCSTGNFKACFISYRNHYQNFTHSCQ